MEEVSLEEKESIAIERIHKFAKIADAMRFDMCVGFSGGKDSQVVYDLMKRSDVPFKAYYNKAFESNTTKNFIKNIIQMLFGDKTIILDLFKIFTRAIAECYLLF